MIALAVSMANCCLSCLVAHGAAFIEASAAMIQRDPVGRIGSPKASRSAPPSWTSGVVPDLDRAARPDNGRVARGQSLGVSAPRRGGS
jgi:hypothetical protein